MGRQGQERQGRARRNAREEAGPLADADADHRADTEAWAQCGGVEGRGLRARDGVHAVDAQRAAADPDEDVLVGRGAVEDAGAAVEAGGGESFASTETIETIETTEAVESVETAPARSSFAVPAGRYVRNGRCSG